MNMDWKKRKPIDRIDWMIIAGITLLYLIVINRFGYTQTNLPIFSVVIVTFISIAPALLFYGFFRCLLSRALSLGLFIISQVVLWLFILTRIGIVPFSIAHNSFNFTFKGGLKKVEFGDIISMELPDGFKMESHKIQSSNINLGVVCHGEIEDITIDFGYYEADNGILFSPKKELIAAVSKIKSNYYLQVDPTINMGRFNELVGVWSNFNAKLNEKEISILVLGVPFPQGLNDCPKIMLLTIIDQNPPKDHPTDRIDQIANSIKTLK